MRNPSSPAISMRSAVSVSRRTISRFSISRLLLLRMDAVALRQRLSRGGFRAGPGFDVDEHVSNPRQSPADGDPDLFGDGVALPHRQFRVHLEVQVDVILQASPPGVALLDVHRARNHERDRADLL